MTTFEAHGNSRTYTAEVNGNQITAARIEVSAQALTAAESLQLQGGNLTIQFAGDRWTAEERDDTLYIDA